jgi:hypothetical protein
MASTPFAPLFPARLQKVRGFLLLVIENSVAVVKGDRVSVDNLP